eukprot:m.231215 g.231215  ORF g.231215 m.231215 type:complete len:1657 (-) comp17362_c0_seq1:123-5093(-)
MAEPLAAGLAPLRNSLEVPRPLDGGDLSGDESRSTARLASRSNSRRQSFFYRSRPPSGLDALNNSMNLPSTRRLTRDRLASSMPDLRVAFNWLDDIPPAKEALSPLARRKHKSLRLGGSVRGRFHSQTSPQSGANSPRRVESPGPNPDEWRTNISRRVSTRGSKRMNSPRGSSRRPRDTTRARSLSPERNATEVPSRNKAYFEGKYNTVVAQVSNMVTAFLHRLDEDDNTNMASTRLGLASEQLHMLADDVLLRSQQRSLSLEYFAEVRSNLNKLIEHCTPEDPTTAHIRRLMTILERPTRLLKLLEYDPSDLRQQEMSDGDAQANLLDLAHTDRSHMPDYVLSRITTNFGPADMELEPADMYKAQETQVVKFLTLGREPTKHDFHKDRLLSSGAYGSVWLGHHIETHEQVAIKILKKQEMVNKNVVKQVLAERDILQFARNPFLINLYCSLTTKESLYIVMEYASGGDLAAYLKNMGPMPLKDARRYFAETVLAVEYIHDFGIIHRDLKPDNLIISSDGHIKLTDFGLSKIGLMTRTTVMVEERTSPEVEPTPKEGSQVLGTPDYIAPEVILGAGYDKAVDWWSMGVILYEFLTGITPFYADTVEEIFQRTINESVIFDFEEDEDEDDDGEQLTPEVKDLILLLLEKDPARRLGTPPPKSHLPSWEEVMPGAFYVKEHDFFYNSVPGEDTCIDWDNLLLDKANFVPVLEDELDTSYFDAREDRYNHGMSSSSNEEEDDSDTSNSNPDAFRDFSRVNPHSASNTPLPGSSPTTARQRRASRAAYYLDSAQSPQRLPSTPRSGTEPNSPLGDAPQRSNSHRHTGSTDRLVYEARQNTRSAPTTPPLTKSNSMFQFPSPGTSPKLAPPALLRASSETAMQPRTLQLPAVAVIESRSPPGSQVDEGLLGMHRLPRTTPPPGDETEVSLSNTSSLAPSTGNSRSGSLHGMADSRNGSLHGLDPAILARINTDDKARVRTDSAVGTTSPASSGHSPKVFMVKVDFDPTDGFGFTLRNGLIRSGRKHKIIQVQPNSTADKAGLRAGCSILKLDNVDVATMHHQQLSRLIRRARGRSITLEVEQPKTKRSKKHFAAKIGSSIRRSFRRSDRDRTRVRATGSPSPSASPSGSLHLKSPPSSLRKTKTATSNLSTETLFDNDKSPSPGNSRPTSREGTLLGGLGFSRSNSDSNRNSSRNRARSHSGSTTGSAVGRSSSWRRSRKQNNSVRSDKASSLDISEPQGFVHVAHNTPDDNFVNVSEANELFRRADQGRGSMASSIFTPTASMMGVDDYPRDDRSVASSVGYRPSSVTAPVSGSSPLGVADVTARHTSPRRTSLLKDAKRSSPLTSPARTPPSTPKGAGGMSPEVHHSSLRTTTSPRVSLHHHNSSSASDPTIADRLNSVRNSASSPKAVRSSPLGLSPQDSRRGSLDFFSNAAPAMAIDARVWESVVRSADMAMSESFSESSSLAPTSPQHLTPAASPGRSHATLFRPPPVTSISAPVSPAYRSSDHHVRDLGWTPMPPTVSSRLATPQISGSERGRPAAPSFDEREIDGTGMTYSEANQQLASVRRASRQATGQAGPRRRASRSPPTRSRSPHANDVLAQAAASPVRTLRLAGRYNAQQGALGQESGLTREGSDHSVASSLAESVDLVRRGLDKETIV